MPTGRGRPKGRKDKKPRLRRGRARATNCVQQTDAKTQRENESARQLMDSFFRSSRQDGSGRVPSRSQPPPSTQNNSGSTTYLSDIAEKVTVASGATAKSSQDVVVKYTSHKWLSKWASDGHAIVVRAGGMCAYESFAFCLEISVHELCRRLIDGLRSVQHVKSVFEGHGAVFPNMGPRCRSSLGDASVLRRDYQEFHRP